KYTVVQEAARKLFGAIASEDGIGVSNALEEMGVLVLSSGRKEQFSRLELVVGYVAGRAQIVPLVELALFATELEDHERAGRYSREARAFSPTSWELYNLCVVEGVISLEAGRRDEAILNLSRSIDACQSDEYASLEC